MSEVLHALRDEYVQLADAYECAEQIGWPVIDLGKRLLVAREELQAAQAIMARPLAERCFECEELIEPGTEHESDGHCYHPTCCPGCDADEPAPNCSVCGQMIDGWAHPDGKGNYHCDKCCPTCDHIESNRWCECTDQFGSGPCPVCGGELFPF